MRPLLEDWKRIFDLQDKFYPNWRTELPHTLYGVGLAGEVGEVCGTITHLEGGGTNNRQYTKENVLHQCVDVYIQIILLLEHYGFSSEDFKKEFAFVVNSELPSRLKDRMVDTP